MWRSWRWIAVLTLTTTLAVVGCGSDDATGGGDDATDPITTAGEDTSGGDGSDDGAPLDARTMETLEDMAEATTTDGATVLVGVDCDAQIGGQLLHVAATGLAEGLYTATVEPGGREIQFNVPPGLQASPVELTEPSYTVTLPEVDGGLELTVDGCG